MKADKSLTQFINNWDNLFNAFTDIITIHDNDFNIIYANDAALKTLSIPLHQRKKVKCYQYYHGSKRPPENCISCKSLKKQKPALLEIFEPHLNKSLEIMSVPRMNGSSVPVGSIHIARDITERKQSEKELRYSQEKLRNLTAHLQHIRERERKRIAREIHDELGQELAVLKLEISRLGNQFPRNEKSFRNSMESISERIALTIGTVQKIVSELRPALIDKIDLQTAIQWQVTEFQRRTGITCKLTFDKDLMNLDKEKEINIFRVIQELLTNILRHSRATKVKINFKVSDSKLVLCVKDNGTGIKEEQLSSTRSFGIIGMNERVSFMGGVLTIKGIPEKGTTVTVSIPREINS